jgi:Xaa-Pro aminopeptidase
MLIRERLSALREQMAQNDVAAYVVPTSDPHQSEYPPERWKAREWISGFSGSAGTVVVTATSAGLWTDSRYFLAAEKALSGSSIELHRMEEPGVLDYPQWLTTVLAPGDTVGFDGLCMSLASARALDATLKPHEIRTRAMGDLFALIWSDRSPLPGREVYPHDSKFAGASRGEKLSVIRGRMRTVGASYHIISTLADIAWLLNLRGNDVDYNPVAVAHLILGLDGVELFIGEGQIPHELLTELESDGVRVRPYEEALEAVSVIEDGNTVLISPTQISVAFTDALSPGVKPLQQLNLTTTAKSRKNSVEMDHLRNTMIRDGVAMVRFLHWLSETLGESTVTELSAEKKLTEFRQQDENYVCESFRAISAYRGHGASPHYAATPSSNVPLEQAGLYLIDSGAHYQDGTTDITRTVSLGSPSDQERNDYTLVLKGHIGLATLHFPVGTTGEMIDVIAREHLWRVDANYGHGTGHGVGFFLNVHEGPVRISRHYTGIALEPGMLISNEPGLYRNERYGIRIENLVLVREGTRSEFGSFLCFETVSLCPLDRSLIDLSLLAKDEIDWINVYHRRVRDLLLGHLTGSEREWLERNCAPL